MSTATDHPLFVQSLAKGLSVLQAFRPEAPALTLTDLAGSTGLPLAAVQRYTHTLQSLGFLTRNARKEFSLGPQALALARAGQDGSELRRLAEPRLMALGESTGLSVNLSALQGMEVIIIFRHEVARYFKMDLREGSRLPAHCTAMGKVLLAALPPAELRARLEGARLERITPQTITSRDDLERALGAVRQAGHAMSDGEASPSLLSLAVPVLNRRGEVVAAASLSLPRVEDGIGERARARDDLLQAGGDISRRLGYQGPYPLINHQPPDMDLP